MQPFNQFGPVFASERGDARASHDVPTSTSGSDVTSMDCGTGHVNDDDNASECDSEVEPNIDENAGEDDAFCYANEEDFVQDDFNESLIGGDHNVTIDDVDDILEASNGDESTDRDVQFAIDLTNAKIPRFVYFYDFLNFF